jgi:hypothetical protein
MESVHATNTIAIASMKGLEIVAIAVSHHIREEIAMTWLSDRIRRGLWDCGGDGTVARLHLEGAQFMNPEFIESCLRCLALKQFAGDDFSPLEMLAIEVLMDSSSLTREEIAEHLKETERKNSREAVTPAR